MLKDKNLRFSPASNDETIVFGSMRPGYRSEQVSGWIDFMRDKDIQHVCCLLTDSQLEKYAGLLHTYRGTFGTENVCWAPIEDFQLVTLDVLRCQILPFLSAANEQKESVVVHCSGGVGRTGQVLAAWLVAKRGFTNRAAISAVRKLGRNPYEAAIAAPFRGHSPWRVAAEFQHLLNQCRLTFISEAY